MCKVGPVAQSWCVCIIGAGLALQRACTCKLETYWPCTQFTFIVLVSWEELWGLHVENKVCDLPFTGASIYKVAFMAWILGVSKMRAWLALHWRLAWGLAQPCLAQGMPCTRHACAK